ncbi:MAG: DUF6326 family protein [Flavobacteriaceae bacterium]|jgi:hypothetical protein|uniref:DUF6326 family protein n=1 Tax=Flagellimonas TaxID=444459 RepID=UPI000E2528B3|nr:DUF6326 family protein [Flavobacteriaceae bacterium]
MSSTNTSPLKDFNINIKIKLAALWASVTFCYLYGDYFELYTPGKVESLISGNNVLNTPTILFVASLVMAIPPLMIVFSLLLKPSLNKWLNIIFGLFFTIIMLLIAIGSLTPWYTFYVFLAVVEAILTSIIVWKSFKWPRNVE